MSKLLSIPELAEKLSYSRTTVWRMYQAGQITAEIEVVGHPRLCRFDEAKVREELRPKAKRRDP